MLNLVVVVVPKFQFPPLREGRHGWLALLDARNQFQFPPLREGRLAALGRVRTAKLISIPAPARGATGEGRRIRRV